MEPGTRFQKFWNPSNRFRDRFQNFGPGTRSCSPLVCAARNVPHHRPARACPLCHGSLQNPPNFSRFLQIFPRNSTHVNILDICMEYSRESILTVGLNRSPPSIEEVDMYKYPQGGSFVNQAFPSAKYKVSLPSSLASTTLFS